MPKRLPNILVQRSNFKNLKFVLTYMSKTEIQILWKGLGITFSFKNESHNLMIL